MERKLYGPQPVFKPFERDHVLTFLKNKWGKYIFHTKNYSKTNKAIEVVFTSYLAQPDIILHKYGKINCICSNIWSTFTVLFSSLT